jgi:hypothetical protein
VLSRKGRPPFLSLICTRCGHVEQHARYVLERASKPVPSTVSTRAPSDER